MKKKMSIVASSLLFVATAQALSIKDDLQNSIEIFKKEDIRIISAKDIDSVYQLKLSSKGKSFEGYITKDKKYIFFGTALDLKTGKQLFVQTDMSKYDDKQAFEFGTGKDEYYVFTDPECPYCKRFETQWDKLKSKVKFHTFLFPLSFHKHANDMSLYILNQKNNADKSKALLDISLHNNKKYETIKNLSVKKKKVLVEKLNNQMKIAKEMFVNGAPAVFDKLGRTVRWDTLIKKYDLGTLDTKVIDILVKQKTYIKYGSGKKKLYLFTDVDCPFCKKEFTSGRLDKLAKDYTIYVFLHPLTKLHPQSFAKSAFILSQKTNKQKVWQLKRFFKGAVLSKNDNVTNHYLYDCGIDYSIMRTIAQAERHKKRDIGYPYLISFNNHSDALLMKEELGSYWLDTRTIDCKSKTNCINVFKNLKKMNITNLDMGAYQLNYNYHKHKEEIYFNLKSSYIAACNYVTHNVNTYGYSWDSIARYHSYTKKHRERYLKTLLKLYNKGKL